MFFFSRERRISFYRSIQLPLQYIFNLFSSIYLLRSNKRQNAPLFQNILSYPICIFIRPFPYRFGVYRNLVGELFWNQTFGDIIILSSCQNFTPKSQLGGICWSLKFSEGHLYSYIFFLTEIYLKFLIF